MIHELSETKDERDEAKLNKLTRLPCIHIYIYIHMCISSRVCTIRILQVQQGGVVLPICVTYHMRFTYEYLASGEYAYLPSDNVLYFLF